jgi:hypothetical protein
MRKATRGWREQQMARRSMLHRTPTFSHDFHASADAQSIGKVCSTLAKQERTFEGERR